MCVQFIYPRVVGSSVGLPPLWTLAAALLGGKLFGILGMIFFITLVAVIYSLVETAKANKLKIYAYLKHLLTEIPKHMDDTNLDFLEDLLPWSENLPEECRKNI